ncbi:MAG TPA: redoxin domain-containing protein [Phycisphaerae bacterium]|nr:redoxin domain-containing protein [Phycisphaerae bacterium]HNU44234.1 redoxin domain-containing protein [Phycisphaerae bacterium]
MKRTSGPVFALAVCLFAPLAGADLTIGDAAPRFQLDTWLKGEAVDVPMLQGRGVLVLEFWATWCGPCRASIPHLTRLQTQYAAQGLVIVGVTKQDDRNKLDAVRSFVQRQGDQMAYAVAFDKDGRTYDAYMRAAGQDGIPTAFVVDRSGRVAWIGSPFALDAVLPAVLAGTYDVDTARQAAVLRTQLLQIANPRAPQSGSERRKVDEEKLAAQVAEIDKLLERSPKQVDTWELKLLAYLQYESTRETALGVAEKAIAQFQGDATSLQSLATTLLRGNYGASFNKLATRAAQDALKVNPNDYSASLVYIQALAAQRNDTEIARFGAKLLKTLAGRPPDLHGFATTLAGLAGGQYTDLALRAVNDAIKARPTDAGYVQSKFFIMARGAKEPRDVRAVGREFLNKAQTDPVSLNAFASELLADPLLGDRYKELALEAAQRCHELSGGTNWEYVLTLAVAKLRHGATAEALEMFKKAVELCQDEEQKKALEARAQEFEKDKQP